MKLNSDAKSITLINSSNEIYILKRKNAELIEELKRLNLELDVKLVKKVDNQKQENEEAALDNEMECFKKMKGVYEKEMALLKGKLKVDAEPERIIELQIKAKESAKLQDKLHKSIKEIEKKVKDMGKALEKQNASYEDSIYKTEVYTNITS